MDLSGIKRLLKCAYAFKKKIKLLFLYKMVESWSLVRMPGGVGEKETRVSGKQGSREERLSHWWLRGAAGTELPGTRAGRMWERKAGR